MKGTLNILTKAYAAGVRKIIFISSIYSTFTDYHELLDPSRVFDNNSRFSVVFVTMVVMKLVCLIRLGHCSRIASGEKCEISTGIPSSYVLSFYMNVGDMTQTG